MNTKVRDLFRIETKDTIKQICKCLWKSRENAHSVSDYYTFIVSSSS